MKNTEKLKEKYQDCLKSDENFIGQIMGSTFPLKWIVLLGPLGTLFMKQYMVVVSDKRVHFNKLNMMGKAVAIDSFDYDEIKTLNIKKGIVKYKVRFHFKNDKKLTLSAQHLAATKKLSESLVSPEAIEYLIRKFK